MSRKIRSIRIACLIMAFIMLCTAPVALADQITSNGNFIQTYRSKDLDDKAGLARIDPQESTYEDGWYYTYSQGGTYVRSSDVKNLTPTPTPTPSPSPTPSLKPGETAAPTATPGIQGTADPSYDGTILSYLVPAGGLWLYNAIDGTPSLSVAAGVTIKLNSTTTANWYSTYYNSKTYYVPESLLYVDNNANPTATIAPTSVKSLTIAVDTNLFTAYNTSTRVLSGTTTHTLLQGTRVNVTHVQTTNTGGVVQEIYSYVIDGKTYYFDATGTTKSTASVVSSEDAQLLFSIKVAGGTRLYRSTDKTAKDFVQLSSDQTLLGQKYDKDWYRVQYSSELFYLLIADTSGNPADVETVVVGGELKANTFLATAGTQGAHLYTSRTMSGAVPAASAQSGYTLTPGESIMASPYDTNWYTCAKTVPKAGGGTEEKTFYLFIKDFSSSTSTSNMSSTKMFLDNSIDLYDRMTATKPSTIKLKADYYVVTTVDANWYSIIFDNTTYYFKKEANAATNKQLTITQNDGSAFPPPPALQNPVLAGMPPIQVLARLVSGTTYEFYHEGATYQVDIAKFGASGNEQAVSGTTETPIGTTAQNKTYYVVIGMSGAPLYTDANCATLATIRLSAGELVQATRYTSSLYIVDRSGAKYYLPVAYITSVRDGDDASVTNSAKQEEPISNVIVGEVNNSYTTEVISYQAPKGGLWLYRAMSAAAQNQALCLNEGTMVKLSLVDPLAAQKWYTTWYGGTQYYVPASSLIVADDMTNTTSTYSVVLNQTVNLFTNSALTAATSITLPANAKINVKVALKATNGTITSFSYVHTDGKTYYFKGAAVDAGTIMGATYASNTDTSLITKITLSGNVWVYSSPNTSSSSIQIKSATTSTVYGVNYNAEWYKIIYDDAVWYLKQNAAGINQTATEQITVTSEATTSTFTVVIGMEGAKSYTKPTTNTALTTVNGQQHAVGMLNYAGAAFDLAPGKTIQAGKYDATWYTYGAGSQTLYFQNGKTSSSVSNDSVRSYQMTVSGQIDLYTTISDVATKIRSIWLEAGKTYNFRTVNKDWSSVVIGNVTYYVKNADINATDKEASIPIASTSVGNSYKITIGAATPIYASEKLSGSAFATVAAGHQTTGLKMYVQGVDTTKAPDQLVYKISYGGRTGYIPAIAVTGVLEGDEVAEAKQAAQEQNKDQSQVAIGSQSMYTFTAGTVLYSQKSTTATTISLPAQIVLNATKVDASWYSVQYNNQTYYIPVSVIEPKAGTTGQQAVVNVGESYTYTFTSGTAIYEKAENGEPIYDIITVGSVYSIKKISENWYEVVFKGKTCYIKVTDITLPIIQNPTATTPPTTTGVTSDGTGYITSLLTINPTTGTVNMRKTASTTATVLDRIPKGTQVSNLGYTKDASGVIWYQIKFNGQTGYVRGDLVLPVGTVEDKTASQNPAQDIGKSLLVNMEAVNVRTGAGTNFNIVGKMAKNTTVVPLDYTTGTDNLTWYKFQYNASTTAWIRGDYLTGSAANTAQQSGNVAVKAGGTNLRSGPSDTFNVVMKLDRDTIVTILGTSTDQQEVMWYRVTVDGTSGYLRYDLVRPLTSAEQATMQNELAKQYTELKSGSKGAEVIALQQQLIVLGYLPAGSADGNYGPKTATAVMAFQKAKGLSATGIATPGTQAAMFNTSNIAAGSVQSLDWFGTGVTLINANKNIQIFDIQAQVTWNATYINGANHADVVPASKTDADKLKANNITGSYVRRPIIVTIAGSKYAGSMYAVGHGSTSYVSYFSGVMCIHFTGSKTHGSDNVDKDHQSAITEALVYANSN